MRVAAILIAAGIGTVANASTPVRLQLQPHYTLTGEPGAAPPELRLAPDACDDLALIVLQMVGGSIAAMFTGGVGAVIGFALDAFVFNPGAKLPGIGGIFFGGLIGMPVGIAPAVWATGLLFGREGTFRRTVIGSAVGCAPAVVLLLLAPLVAPPLAAGALAVALLGPLTGALVAYQWSAQENEAGARLDDPSRPLVTLAWW